VSACSTRRRLFYRSGISGVGVDTIVADARVAKMTLYKHFGSKDELVAEFLRRHAALGLARMQPVGLQPGATAEERLLGVFDALEAWFGSAGFQGCAVLNASAEITDPRHPGIPVIQQYLNDKRAIVASMTAELEVADADAQALADQLVTLIHGATVLAHAQRSVLPARQARQAAAALISMARRT
jgi:AcrR family transcriptional regulator